MARKKMGADKLVVQNAAKTLLANIRFASVDDPIRVITITSSTPNEGKSTVALNLAQAIATSGKSVVLVECDMRRRSMGQMIGVRSRGGLYAVLSEQMKLEEAVVETSQKNLYFLDSEPHIPNPADIIVSRRFKRLVERLRASFQYVIFDTPPVGTFIDAAEVGQLSDGVLFVVRENFAKRTEVTAAFDQLRRAEVHVIGAVMNYCETETSEYYYSYYTKDGKKARSSEGSSRGAAQGVVPPAVQATGSRFSRQ
ncbi:CpsD/CapB family tyrosine-protein kinase [Collinsella tanakaei]|uniref:CpsD/CapB family tyrosine-protein kinase n=1 Tax=Collinsella tanakaei TaxID=626935 RepID=UPI0025A37E21|nr:CpsD/CapB family tyrosine-protein kinase [Collinsella tanakaei]MDM8300492.1 CpsD/CapB family tyrosine-protein kinase [Collinsella tanakaei]